MSPYDTPPPRADGQRFQSQSPQPMPIPNAQGQPSSQPMQQGTNGWAIAAIICAFLIPLLGLIFAIVALVQISHNPAQRGKGLAIAALIISILWAFIWVFLVFIGFMAYFGVLSPGNFMPDRCDIPAGLDCVEKPVIGADSDTVMVKVTNNMGTNIVITQFIGDATSDCKGTEDIEDVNMEDGETAVLTYKPGADFKAGERAMCRFSIEYLQGSGDLTHRISAYVVGIPA